MHELGHNLGLRHGGVDNVNCKPHHVSVMNYVYQFPNSVRDRPLNYSPLLGVAAPLTCSVPNATGTGLNEACLDEALGIGLLYTGKIAFGPLVGIPAKPTSRRPVARSTGTRTRTRSSWAFLATSPA